MRAELASGRMPTDALLEGDMILLAGALLVTPGVRTDCFGVIFVSVGPSDAPTEVRRS